MACGIGTFFHVVRFKIPFTRYYYGTGIVSVLGITTTQIVIGLNSISSLMVPLLLCMHWSELFMQSSVQAMIDN